MKTSDIFCYGCNENLPCGEFDLIKSHKPQLCIKCENKKRIEDAAKEKKRRESEFASNHKIGKVKTNEYNTWQQATHKQAMNEQEERRLAKQLEEELGL